MLKRRLTTPLLAAAAALGLLACDSLDVPIAFDQGVDVSIALGAATGAAAGQTAPADASYPIAMSPVRVDLVSSNSQIAANRSKIKSIGLTSVSVTPTTNTLTGPTPPIDLYIGPAGATAAGQGVRIATLPAIPAGSTAKISADIDVAAVSTAQPWLTSLDFTVIPTATLVVKKGDTVPGGSAQLRIVLGIEATIAPLK